MFALSGYSDIREIGAGGQAKVYVATQNSFQRKVAIKVLLPALSEDPEFAERFLREARIVAGLAHPHIVPVYDFGQQDGTLYMVMENLGGGDLSKKLEGGAVGIEDILQITTQIALALNFAHEKGFVHRDVKPDNVLFREDGSAVLTDFGIARQQNAANQLTMVGQVLGTPKYMSPEQLQDKKVDGRADIYSLGIMFYQMCTGHAPYEDKDFTALAMKHIQSPIPKLPQEFIKYQKMFERMVAKEPEKRFQSGMEVAKLIQMIRSGKLDAAAVDSANAAVLKRTAGAAPQASQSANVNIAAANSRRVSIPREFMVELQDMDPLLDANWKEKVTLIYNKMGQEQRQYVYTQFLEPKGIQLDTDGNGFHFYGRKSVQEINAEFITNSLLQATAMKLEKAEQMLRTTTDILAFADALESSLSLIDRFDSQENLRVQKEKNALRSAFLDDLVLIVRGANFNLPPSQRFLTIDIVKSYIIQVFLKQQMMGYRFKTSPLSALELHPNPFVSTEVAPEVKTRQCDIVKVDKHYFVIGPVRNASQNPFSIRRFLQEDSTMGGKLVYFNAAVIVLDELTDAAKQEHLRWVLSRIVTLERQLSLGVVELVRDIETIYKDKLVPMLLKPIEADGTEIEKIIEERLIDYEKNLSLLVLGKIPKGVRELAQSSDDFEYMFFSLRRLVIDIACDVRDFAAQSTTVWSQKAEELDMRMMSYLRLLDKRKETVFVKSTGAEIEPTLDPAMPLAEFNTILEEYEPQIEALKVKLREIIRKKKEPKSAFKTLIEKLFRLEDKKLTPDDIQNQINTVKHKCLVALIKARKRYPAITVYLEFEDLVPVDEAIRRYALANGKDGLGRLPILIELPEVKSEVDILKIKEAMEADIFKAPAKWSAQAK